MSSFRGACPVSTSEPIASNRGPRLRTAKVGDSGVRYVPLGDLRFSVSLVHWLRHSYLHISHNTTRDSIFAFVICTDIERNHRPAILNNVHFAQFSNDIFADPTLCAYIYSTEAAAAACLLEYVRTLTQYKGAQRNDQSCWRRPLFCVCGPDVRRI
jgi:hypothetical protein